MRATTPSSSLVRISTDPALGYSACFLSAVNAVARAQKVNLPKDIEVHADVSIGTPEGRQGFGLAVELLVKASYEAAQREELEGVIKAAHEMCPYSNAVYVSMLTQPQQHPGQGVPCLSSAFRW